MKKELALVLALYIASVNILAFALFGADKRRAVRGQWRIPEAALLLSALLGGSAGALLGMRVFHHKTKHMLFAAGLPLILLIELAAAYCVIVRFFY